MTLTTGKILRSGYFGNGCHGDEKSFYILKYSINWGMNVPGRSIKDGSKNLRYLLPWKPICCHSNKKMGVIGGKPGGFL